MEDSNKEDIVKYKTVKLYQSVHVVSIGELTSVAITYIQLPSDGSHLTKPAYQSVHGHSLGI